MIEFFYEDVDVPGLDSEHFNLWISEVCNLHNKILDEVSVVFCSDEYLLEMNKKHLKHDYYTDIITFDYCVDNLISGDLFISIDRVKENGELLKEGFEKELRRVVVHGVLHLCGFGDKTDEEQTLMTKKENEALSLFVSRGTN